MAPLVFGLAWCVLASASRWRIACVRGVNLCFALLSFWSLFLQPPLFFFHTFFRFSKNPHAHVFQPPHNPPASVEHGRAGSSRPLRCAVASLCPVESLFSRLETAGVMRQLTSPVHTYAHEALLEPS